MAATDGTRITREELYEKVWSEALATLGPKLGLSDVGLAKMCRRMQVPVPWRGYWAKKEAGQAVAPTPLPKLPRSEWREEVRVATIHPARQNDAGELVVASP